MLLCLRSAAHRSAGQMVSVISFDSADYLLAGRGPEHTLPLCKWMAANARLESLEHQGYTQPR